MDTTNNAAKARTLLKKYLEGNCSPQEEQQVLRWYYGFNSTDDLNLEPEYKARLLLNISNNTMAAVSKPKQHRLISLFKPIIGIAAMLTLIAAALLFYRQDQKGKIKELQYSELVTLPGERKMVQLKDGSKIWLNNASKLTWPENFTDSLREVSLEGEAFFEVVHQEHKPFIIHTKRLNVQVLGTSFDIKSFAEENEVVVTVASGKVGVSKISQHTYVMLLPGERAIYKVNQQSLEKEQADVAVSMAWKNNVLAFKYETLGNICSELERWYGVKITCNHPGMLLKKYTLKQENESLDNVLKVLSSGDFHYKITGRTVEIWP